MEHMEHGVPCVPCVPCIYTPKKRLIDVSYKDAYVHMKGVEVMEHMEHMEHYLS